MLRITALCGSFLVLFYSTTNAGSINVSSKLKDVTVYRNQARLVNEAAYNLTTGSSELIIDNISNNIDPATLQVFINGNAELISASYNHNYITTAPQSAQLMRWEDSIELLSDNVTRLTAEKSTYEGEELLLNSNRSLGNEKTTFTAAEVEALANMYRKRVLEIKLKLITTDDLIKKVADRLHKIQNQVNEFNAQKNRPTGQIVLTLYATQPVSGMVRCAYNITGAGWQQQYDLRSEGVGETVTLLQKADIYQNSGIDWHNVNLSICTGNPNLNNNRPILNPIYLNYIEYRPQVLRGSYGYAAPMAETMNMAMYKRKDDDKAVNDTFYMAEPQAGTVSDNTVNVTYALKLPQDIPGDGKPHTVQYDKQQIPATYIYHSVPKLDPAAFLLAKIYDWGKYNLTPGNANIFFEGSYVGKSYINPNVTGDTMLLSFGRDERINIKRNKLTDLSEKKCIGSNKVEKYVYEITMKNNKQKSIELEVLDQLPVSRQQDIKVEADSIAGAEYLAEIGKLSWKVTLAPSQSKTIRFGYNVKYPKAKEIAELN